MSTAPVEVPPRARWCDRLRVLHTRCSHAKSVDEVVHLGRASALSVAARGRFPGCNPTGGEVKAACSRTATFVGCLAGRLGELVLLQRVRGHRGHDCSGRSLMARAAGDREDVDWGPQSALVAYIRQTVSTVSDSPVSGRRLSSWTGNATRNRMAAGVAYDTTIAPSRAAELLAGKGAAPTWEQLKLVAEAAALAGSGGGRDAYDAVAMQEVWRKAQTRHSPRSTVSAAHHFAHMLNDWGVATSPRRPGLSATVCLANSEAGPSADYSGVFDPLFQSDLIELQEDKLLRRDGHSFQRNVTYLPTGFRVWGGIQDGGARDAVRTFIGVEASRFGAVSVFFRDYQERPTADELVARWICRSWAMALQTHHLLGATGTATAAIIVNEPGVLGLSAVRPKEPTSWVFFGDSAIVQQEEVTLLQPRRYFTFSNGSRVADTSYSAALHEAQAAMHAVHAALLGLPADRDAWDFKTASQQVQWFA